MAHDHTGEHGHGDWLPEAWQMPLAIGAGVTLGVGFALAHWVGPRVEVASLGTIGHVLIWISLALGGVHGVEAAWASLREFKPDIDVLMVVGAALAAAIGHPEEGALLLFLFTLAGALEHRALARAKDAVSRLNKLMPTSAMRRGTGGWESVEPELLERGDVILVKPGQTVPADAMITEGRSSLDQSTLTGESLPRDVEVGDDIYAGTLNQQGSLEARVTRPVTESSLRRILALVLEAQERRRPVQRIIDKFSTPYTVVVFIAAIATLLGFMFIGEGKSFAEAAYRAITLLIVCSPCALVISTPTATLCGLSRAARAGVLIKGGDALERLSDVSRVVLDKTGTLTTGRIEVMKVEPIAASTADTLLRVAYGVEEQSTHPIATAIVRMARDHEIEAADVASIVNVPGAGVEGDYDGSPVRIGSMAFCAALIPVCFRPHTARLVDQVREDGGLPVVVAHDSGALVLALADETRPGAAELTGKLRDVGVSRVAMLTGDHPVIAERLARELGIDHVHAELLPEDKVAHVERIRAEQGDGGLAVVGDGVNDAPALAVADIGLAMGGIGADAALETADVVLLHDDLGRVPWSIGLARRVRRVMVANLVFATGVIAVLAVLTLFGRVPMSLGVLGHEGSTLLVVANSLRLLAHREPR